LAHVCVLCRQVAYILSSLCGKKKPRVQSSGSEFILPGESGKYYKHRGIRPTAAELLVGRLPRLPGPPKVPKGRKTRVALYVETPVYTFSSCTSRRREKENVSINLAGVSIFFILDGPEKGNYTSWANVVTTPYTSKCSLTAPRQPIISLFSLGRDESLSDAGNLVNSVVKRCKSNCFGVSL
jgi:hypothetical protein